jgi:ABC-2 type transport system permease protein
MEQVAGEELAAVVIVPAGYGAQALDPAAEAALKPTVIADPASNAGQTAQSGIQAVLARLAGAVQAVQLSAQALEAQGGIADEAFLEGALARAVEAWQDPPLTVTTSQSGTLLEEEEPPIEPNDFAHSSAGIMVQFAMAGLIGAAEILVLERKSGAMRRMLTTATSRLEIILGHFLAMYLMILLQLVVLTAFGQIVLGVNYAHAPLATLVMVLTTALWSASLGLLIGIFSKTQEQSIMFTLILMLLLSGLGGAWMPLEFTSQTFQTVGHLTPVAWAIDGLENIALRGLGLESVLLPAAILVGYAALLFAIGVWRFRFE